MMRVGVRSLVLLLIMGMVFGWAHASVLTTDTPAAPANAFVLTSIPDNYGKLEKLFAALKEGGAQSVIIGPTVGDIPDAELLPNIVYLAHMSGLNVYFILPGRSIRSALSIHPDWEDLRYDLTSGTLQGTGKLDLFNPDASDYLVSMMKSVASYWVDGIMLGSDFFYGTTEGMSSPAMEEYKRRYSAALVPGRAIARVGNTGNGTTVLEYGEGFREWAEIKKDRLVTVVQNIVMAARTVNRDIKFGIPLHGPELENSGEALARWSFDLNAFNLLNPDFYWLVVPHRDVREDRHLTYKKSIEELVRVAQNTSEMVKEPCRSLVVVQTATRSGRVLPFTEIEDAAAAVKKGGNSCMALMIRPEGMLPAALTKKIFKKQAGT